MGCSFDDKTGIWTGSEEEKIRISELEDEQNENIVNIYLSEAIYFKEIPLNKNYSWIIKF